MWFEIVVWSKYVFDKLNVRCLPCGNIRILVAGRYFPEEYWDPPLWNIHPLHCKIEVQVHYINILPSPRFAGFLTTLSRNVMFGLFVLFEPGTLGSDSILWFPERVCLPCFEMKEAEILKTDNQTKCDSNVCEVGWEDDNDDDEKRRKWWEDALHWLPGHAPVS